MKKAQLKHAALAASLALCMGPLASSPAHASAARGAHPDLPQLVPTAHHLATATVQGNGTPGWQLIDGNWYWFHNDGTLARNEWLDDRSDRYYLGDDGTPRWGFILIDDNWYWFEDDGRMARNGWRLYNGQWFWFGADGKLATSTWVDYQGSRYHVAADGHMQWGFILIDGGWYWIEEDGRVCTGGWRLYNDQWYWFDTTGQLVTSAWVDYAGDRYRVGDKGAMLTGLVTVDNEQYWLDASGIMVRNAWRELDGERSYFDEQGRRARNHWAHDGSGWCWLGDDGKISTGWQMVGERRYWFDAAGHMASGPTRVDGDLYLFSADGQLLVNQTVEIDGNSYTSDAEGRLLTGWQTIDGREVYYDDLGVRARGWRMLDGSWRFFMADGSMAKDSWIADGTIWYRVDAEGRLLTGWQELDDGKRYWFDSSGAMARGATWIEGELYALAQWGELLEAGWHDQNGARYLVDDRGVAATSWRLIEGDWYWFDEQGRMATGQRTVEGKVYYFDENGRMASGTWVLRNGAWSYVDASGAMAIGWNYIGGAWYWFDANGVMAAERWVDQCYLTGSGAMATGVFFANGLWYAANESGQCLPWSVVNVAGDIYVTGADCSLLAGWQLVGGKWYHLAHDGRAIKGWDFYEGTWYYLQDDGSMLVNGWADDCYMGENGVMMRSIITPSGEIVGADGRRMITSPEGQTTLSVSYDSYNGMQIVRLGAEESTTNKALFYLHGGSYTSGIGPSHWNYADSMAKASGATVIIPAYPIAPFSTYKESYQQVLGAWRACCREFGSANITLLGDSAGAGYAAGVAEWLVQLGEEVPGHTVLISPWLDITCSSDSMRDAVAAGRLPTVDGLVYAGRLWAGGAWSDDAASVDYRLSPINGSVAGMRNVTIFAGELESLLGDIQAYQRKLQDAGVRNELVVGTGLLHDWGLNGSGEHPEAIDKVAQLINEPVA